MSPTSPSVRRVLARALRERCPACGEGQVFLTHRFRGERDCSVCGWRLERCEGHWIGGTEVNMLLTFPAGVITLGAFGYFFGWSLWTPVFGALFTIPFSLAVFRRSRCLFYAVDYLFDPTRDDAPPHRDDLLRDGPDGPAPSRPPRRQVQFVPRQPRPAFDPTPRR